MKFRSRNKLLLAAFIFLLGLCFGRPTFAETSLRYVYLGLAGNGTGMGMFGHAFILITSSRGNFFDAKVYQYNIQVPPDFKLSMQSALTVQSFPFRVFSDGGVNFIHRYTSENRAVYLYELNLDDRAARTLIANLEQDKTARERTTMSDYNLATNNCVTKTYEQINAVVPANMGLPLTPYRPTPTSFFKLSRESVSLAVPLATPLVLKNHPLIRSTHYFKPVQIMQYERLIEQKRSIGQLVKICRTDEKTASALDLLTSNINTASSIAYVLSLQDIFLQCATGSAQARAKLVHILDIIRYAAPNDKVVMAADQQLGLLLP